MPSSKILLSYNIPPERHETYMRFMINQFIPALHTVGLMNIGVWQTVYGKYPARLLVFVADDEDTLENALDSDVWKKMEGELKPMITNYTCRVVAYEPGFQF
ncbi:MAG: hypothetical protein HY327_00750 [Chloroflexi bacterium]|nr:hypothetical protein [Chloroflexota bacterium]